MAVVLVTKVNYKLIWYYLVLAGPLMDQEFSYPGHLPLVAICVAQQYKITPNITAIELRLYFSPFNKACNPLLSEQ